ncbi:MAG: DUF4062 domain-containing protein [Candidatus Eisenbacteria bacterium]|nr:DUF4062 domain-containing protein [Candidatus Eisenbacteria bacterium]
MLRQRPIIMVSSTVYYQESFLDQVFAALEIFGYTVWMSHAGTLPVNPGLSNFQNCLRAVDACQGFLGIISGRYGSGKEQVGKSITHMEMDRAMSVGKPAWFLVHHDVVVSRQILRQFKPNPRSVRWGFPFEPTSVLEDLRVLEMYEKAMQNAVPLQDRRGNWVQEFFYSHEALRFVEAQFSDKTRVLSLLRRRRNRRHT